MSGLQVYGICSRRLIYSEALRLDQTMIRGDLEIPLVIIQMGVTGLKKTKLAHLLVWGKGRGGSCSFVCVKRL